MNRVPLYSLCISFASIYCCQTLLAANPSTSSTDGHQVRQLLDLETQPTTTKIDRRQALNPAIRPELAANVEWWQAGFVKTSDGWQAAEAIPSAKSGTAILEQYHTKRSAAAKTVVGQMALADWCRSSKLPDQERAHLSQVLMLASPNLDPRPIYKRMGYRLIGGQWQTVADQREAEALARRNQEHLRQWGPTVERIARNWVGNAKQRKLAQNELNGLDNATAIPALMVAAGRDESLAIAICDQLATLPGFEASQAIANIAVQSDWPAVRETAAKRLKNKRIDDFAPILLSEMRSPFTANNSPGSQKPNLMIREQADRYVAVDPDAVPIGVPVTIVYSIKRNQIMNAPNIPLTARDVIDRDRVLGDSTQKFYHQLDNENDLAEEYNSRAAAVLAEVTCQPPCVDPKYWWAWWNVYTGTQPIPKKCQVIRVGPQVPFPSSIRVICCSCLTAGTPICTRQGFVSIEQIQVGDEVLSKNINTGEIDYRPVLQTTERQPVPVTKFVVAGSTITASEGHHFWVSGAGWTKTRELAAGQPIHTATGMSRIESVQAESEPAPVYNLVVADFHTYFVGEGMVLSHDVMQPSPTNIKVPGLEVD